VGRDAAFNISGVALSRFVHELCEVYNDSLEFHNFHHAFTVFAVSAEIVRAVLEDDAAAAPAPDGDDAARQPRRSSLPPLRPIHVLAILLAALVHDVDHPGLSNAFLINTRRCPDDAAAVATKPHPLATRHGDETASMVEAHHVELATRLLAVEEDELQEREPKHRRMRSAGAPAIAARPEPPTPTFSEGLLGGMEKADAVYTIELIKHAVMGTDLAMHKSLSQKLQSLVKVLEGPGQGSGGSGESSWSCKKGSGSFEGVTPSSTAEETCDGTTLAERVQAAVGEDFHHVMVQAILHAADLSNPTLHFDTCAAWSLRLTAEFGGQAKREEDYRNGRNTRGETTTTTKAAVVGTTGAAGRLGSEGEGAADGAADGGAGSDGGRAEAGAEAVPGVVDGAGRGAADGATAAGELTSVAVTNLREKLKPIAKGEVCFVENLILPYWTNIAEVYPPLQRHVARIRDTANTYAAIAAEHAA